MTCFNNNHSRRPTFIFFNNHIPSKETYLPFTPTKTQNFSKIKTFAKIQIMKHLLSILDLSSDDILRLMDSALRLKAPGALKKSRKICEGKSIGIISEKPSTRTTISFAVAANQLGACPIIIPAGELQRKRGETIEDTARTLSRFLDAISYRAFKDEDVRKFAEYSRVPVINALTDKEHPCQALGDFLTIIEKKIPQIPRAGKKILPFLSKLKIAFIGDGNNVFNSWIYLASKMGLNFVHASPQNFSAAQEVKNTASKLAAQSGASISFTDDPFEAARNADVIYTDVWTSMGDEDEEAERKKTFAPYQINSNIIAHAKPDVIVMHCLPARRGEEITDEVMDGPHSAVFDQAENRLHIQKAILIKILHK